MPCRRVVQRCTIRYVGLSVGCVVSNDFCVAAQVTQVHALSVCSVLRQQAGRKNSWDKWRHLDRQRWQAFESYNMVFYMLLYRVNGALDWICSLAFGAGTEHEFLLLY